VLGMSWWIDVDRVVGTRNGLPGHYNDAPVLDQSMEPASERHPEVVVRRSAETVRPELQRRIVHRSQSGPSSVIYGDVRRGQGIRLRLRWISWSARRGSPEKRPSKKRWVVLQWSFRQIDLSLLTWIHNDKQLVVDGHKVSGGDRRGSAAPRCSCPAPAAGRACGTRCCQPGHRSGHHRRSGK